MGSKPLGVLKNIVEAVGMEISYAHEDLVFLEHNSFLFQFTDDDSEILIHVNREADKAAVDHDIDRLQLVASDHQIQLSYGGKYLLSQIDEENIRLEFSRT